MKTINFIRSRIVYNGTVAAVLPIFLSLFLLSGCSGVQQRQASEQASAAMKPGAPELDSQTLYYLLAGELSGHQGDMKTALKFYLPAAENNSDPRIAARAARIAIYAKDNDNAEKATERWLALEPDSRQALQSMIVIKLRKKQPQAASKHILELMALIQADGDVSNDKAFAVIAKLLQSEAELSDAVEVFKILSKSYEDNAHVFLWLSRFAMQAGQYDDALPAITRVITLDPDNAKAYVLKARLLALSGKEDEAVKVMAIAVSKDPDEFVLRKQYASMLIRQDKLEAAQWQFEELYKRRPDDRETLISLGILVLEKQDYKRARMLFEKLGQNPARENESIYYLGRVDEAQKNITKALNKYSQVKPGRVYFDARLRMANITDHLGKLDEAEKILQQLLAASTSKPQRSRVYLVHGHLLQKHAEYKRAIEVYNTALKEDPTNVDLLYAHALTAGSLNMIDSAVAGLKKLLSHEPDNVQALNALGYTLADQTDRFEEALGYIERAFKLNSTDAAILDSLGWVHFRLGNMEKSLEYLRKAFAANHDPEIAAHLGEVLWVNGEQDEALKVWKLGQEINADHRVLKETIKRLSK